MQNDDIKVSIICTCYNQVSYIEDALKGFVNQKTSFPFEVIVHDDASTDGTSEVIARYAERFPDLIVPILQQENQLSKGVSPYRDVLYPIARGKYIARCEGDDYWIDPHKLQKQFDYLELNQEYSAVVHNAIVVDYTNQLTYLSEAIGEDRDKCFPDLILEGGGLLNPTASLFFRKEIDTSLYFSIDAPVGDHFLLMNLAFYGPIRWFSKPMSVYRYGSASSFSVRHRKKTIEEMRHYTRRYVSALQEMNAATGCQFEDVFSERILNQKNSFKTYSFIEEFCGSDKPSLTALRGLPGMKAFQALTKRYFSPRGYDFLASKMLMLNKRRRGVLIDKEAKDPSPLGMSV